MSPVNMTVMWLTFRQLFTKQRLIALVCFSAAPFVIAAIFAVTRTRTPQADLDFLRELYSGVIAFVLLPLTAVVLGTAAFGGEIDDGTIVYLLVKALPRWQVVLSKYVVATVATYALMFIACVLPWLVLGSGPDALALFEAFAAAVGIGAALYCALFVMLGLTSKRSLVAGLLYIVVIEIALSPNVVGLKSLSIREFVMTVAGKLAATVPGMHAGAVSVATVETMGAIIFVGSLVFGIRWLARYEMAERL